jgi:hypothetical protein
MNLRILPIAVTKMVYNLCKGNDKTLFKYTTKHETLKNIVSMSRKVVNSDVDLCI